jgi:type II secretory pathway component PulC
VWTATAHGRVITYLTESWWRLVHGSRPDYTRLALEGVNLVLITVLGYQLARLTLLFIAPHPAEPSVAKPTDLSFSRPVPTVDELQRLRRRNPFAAEHAGAEAERAQPQPVVTDRMGVALRGTVVGEGGPSYAIIRVRGESEDEVCRLGDEVLPGIGLTGIERDRVTLLMPSGEEKVVIMEEGAPADGSGESGTDASPAARNPAQVETQSATVSRALLETQTRDLAALASTIQVGAYDAGRELAGLQVIRLDGASFLHRLGLAQGDVIRSVNGHRVRTPEDLAVLYGELQGAPRLQVEVLRREHPLMLDLTIR